MDMDTESYDWAHDAFVALNAADSTHASPDFNAPPSKPKLNSQTSIERHGQITPPEEYSPPAPEDHRRDSVVPQHSMVPAQLPTELPWPLEHQLQALQEFQPQQGQSQPQVSPDRATKRRRTNTTKQGAANTSQTPHIPDQQTTGLNPQPPKRKRGRPKSQPQPQFIEAYSQDGFPFPVSTARQSHLEKNRVAAHKCRQRRKEYIDGLEARGREASSKNKALKENVALLREEILQLKNEVLRHAGCNFWAVDEYLARCAGDLLGMDAPPLKLQHKKDTIFSPLSETDEKIDVKEDREMSADSNPPPDFDDYFLDSLDDDMVA